jgi:hypothetical protein
MSVLPKKLTPIPKVSLAVMLQASSRPGVWSDHPGLNMPKFAWKNLVMKYPSLKTFPHGPLQKLGAFTNVLPSATIPASHLEFKAVEMLDQIE